MLILILLLIASVCSIEVTFPPSFYDVATDYYWKFQIWSNNVGSGGTASTGHHVIMAVPYYDAQGAQLVPYENKYGDISGSRYRIELFFTQDKLPIPVTGKLSTYMKSSEYQFPGSSPEDFGKYTLWDPGFMTTVETSSIDIGSKYINIAEKYGTGKRYFIVGKNCQNFAGDFLGELKGAFAA